MSYKWEWGWHAETEWKPYYTWSGLGFGEEKVKDWIREQVAKKLVEDYTKKGYSITVHSVTTNFSKFDRERESRGVKTPVTYVRYIIDAETTTFFDTNAPVMGSPIDPLTITLILGIISGIIILARMVFFFLTFDTIRNTISDIGTGISELLGLGDSKAGLGVLFIVILLIIGLYVVGKYWKPWRKRR